MERESGLEAPNPRIGWLDTASCLMDDRFRIPCTNIRFGLDFLIGLVPGIGDIVSLAIWSFLRVATWVLS